MRYRKKPVVIEARKIDDTDYDDLCDIIRWCGGRAVDDDPDHIIAIITLEGEMMASPGDWIIKGVKGEFYPIKDEIFAATYEPAEAAPVGE